MTLSLIMMVNNGIISCGKFFVKGKEVFKNVSDN